HRRGQTLLARDAQLGAEMQIGGGEEGVNPGAFRRLQRTRRLFDVPGRRPRERGDHRPPDLSGDLAHRFGIGRRRDWEAGLDDVHVQPIERARHRELGRHVEREPGGLLAVAQGRVEDDHAGWSGHGRSCSWALPRSQSDNDYRTITTCYKLHGAMDWSALKTFLAVAHERSFSRAAAKVHRTQPAVSQAVRRLEMELGEQLFDRSSKNGTLTEAGRMLENYGQRLVRLAEETE